MSYRDLREFLDLLEQRGELKHISQPISPYLEMTEVSQRCLRQNGPALLFDNPTDFSTPVLTNLFGTPERVALGMGQESVNALRDLGEFLAFLKAPEAPTGFKDALSKFSRFKEVLKMPVKKVRSPVCQQNTIEGDTVNLHELPIQTCWPDDAAPLITWALVITQGPDKPRQNIGIYRQQVIAKNKVIMRWLAHRGGALDFQAWQKAHPGEPFPVAVAVGADPATILAAVTPIPDDLSEFAFAGLLRGHRTAITQCKSHALQVPANAEYILEGFIYPDEMAVEGPFGDHTGYYNETEKFPVFTIEKITHRDNPIYHSTYTGRPPDEPSVLGVAMNELFIPILKKQFPEIIDFYLPPEGCSYRMACVSMKKQYTGHAKRVMLGIWSFLRQFMYTKFIIVVDDDINVRDWQDVIWAITTRMDPKRDCTFIENTPIDYLDFASPVAGLGSKIGLDATNKWPGETQREWGRQITMTEAVVSKVDSLWDDLGIFSKG